MSSHLIFSTYASHLATLVHHDVVGMTVADAEHERGHTEACTRLGEVVDGNVGSVEHIFC